MTQPLALLREDELQPSQVAQAAGPEAGFGGLSTARGQLPLQAMHVQARIDGLLGEVSICQTFINTFDEPLEATYIFPLPDRAAVTRFRMEVNGRVTEGVLRERGEARRQYQQAIQSGYRAAITEEERSGVFSIRVGNLLPGEAAKISLMLVGPLQYSDGEATFRFPLVVAPRYIPGKPLSGPSVGSGVASDTDAVPDASRISPPVLLPGYPNPVQLSLTVAIQPGSLLMRDFRSSLHSVMHEANADGVRVIRLHPGERLNRDFILRFRVASEALQTALSLRPDDGGPEGTFLLTLVPPQGVEKAQRPRDVIFVLDRSGSMEGWKMVCARRAMSRMVDTLTERDRFTVYAFDDTVEVPKPFNGWGLVHGGDRQRFQAVEFLTKIDSRNGTEMARPLELALTTLGGDDPTRDRILVLVTDGQVGNEDQLLQTLGTRVGRLRIFTLGIDMAANDAFLKRLAALGGGSCESVESEVRLDEVMEQIHRQIGTALLSDVQVKPAGLNIQADSLVPGRLPDLFAGAPLFIFGRYAGAAEGSIAVEGRDVAGKPWAQKLAPRRSPGLAVPCVWARGRIRELEDRYAIGVGNPHLVEQQIVETSLRFGVLCRFTAFVAVDRAEVVNDGGRLHKVTQAVEPPAGWDMLEKTDRVLGIPTAEFELSCRLAETPAAKSNAEAGKSAARKTMLAKQVLQEINVGGRVSKKTMLALDDAARDALPPAPPSAPRPAAASAPLVPGMSNANRKDIFTDFDADDLGDESRSQAVPIDPADTDLESSEFELAIEECEEAEEEIEAIDSLADVTMPPSVIEQIPESVARENQVLPLHDDGNGTLHVLMSNPHDQDTIEKLRFILDKDIVPVQAPAAELKEAIDRHFDGKDRDSVDSCISEFTDTALDFTEGGSSDNHRANPKHTAIVKLVNLMILEAINLRSPEIHLAPLADRIPVRYRIDGQWVERDAPPIRLYSSLLNRIKFLAGIDIAEKHADQHGSIKYVVGGRQYDLQVKLEPTEHGQAIIILITPVEEPEERLRRWAKSMLADLRQNRLGDRLASLHVLAERLALFIQDAQQVLVPGEELAGLAELLAELLDRKRPDPTEVAALWAKSEELLQGYAQGPTVPVPVAKPQPRQKEFWK
ncbi:MAG: VWA domain-containing protein [Planctomycetia bacterium]|nr:VWA domain-containing protein [Planctomycetia bacterium]